MIKENTYVYLVAHNSASLFGLSILTHTKKYNNDEFNLIFEEAIAYSSLDVIDDNFDNDVDVYDIKFKDVYQAAVDYMIREFGFGTIPYDNKLYFPSNELIYSTDGSHKDIKKTNIIKRVQHIIDDELEKLDDDLEDFDDE